MKKQTKRRTFQQVSLDLNVQCREIEIEWAAKCEKIDLITFSTALLKLLKIHNNECTNSFKSACLNILADDASLDENDADQMLKNFEI